MASLIVTPEHQIQRLNVALTKVNELSALDTAQLIKAPNTKAWSALEIIEHLNIAYQLYVAKIDTALAHLPSVENTDTTFKVRWWQRFVIEGTRPKRNKRKMKMKTLKRFEPILATNQLDRAAIAEVFSRFEQLHQHFKNAILESRSKNTSKLKISSAIGPIVSFYLPECFEFLLAHIERHMLQIEEALQAN